MIMRTLVASRPTGTHSSPTKPRSRDMDDAPTKAGGQFAHQAGFFIALAGCAGRLGASKRASRLARAGPCVGMRLVNTTPNHCKPGTQMRPTGAW